MYSVLSELGKSVNYHSSQTDPLTYCLYPNYNSQWIHGSTSVNLLSTPYCTPCQNLMADRCSNSWDEACQIYVDNNCDTSWPNTASIDSISQKQGQNFIKFTPNTGDNLIRNSIERYFFDYPNVNKKMSQFDPNVSNSPHYVMYSSNSLSPKWSLKTNLMLHDDHPHVKLMLQNPQACFDLLARFHYIQKTQPRMFSSTLHTNKTSSLFQQFLKENDKIFSAYNRV